MLNPWWAVDLGVKLTVAGVRFTNRGEDMGTQALCKYMSVGLVRSKVFEDSDLVVGGGVGGGELNPPFSQPPSSFYEICLGGSTPTLPAL